MKTAMQELIEMMNDAKEKGFKDLDWISLIETYSLLEKEKRQIIEAANYGLEHFGNIAEKYYNQNYSKNKEEKCYSFISQIDGKNKKCLKCGKDIFEHYNQNK